MAKLSKLKALVPFKKEKEEENPVKKTHRTFHMYGDNVMCESMEGKVTSCETLKEPDIPHMPPNNDVVSNPTLQRLARNRECAGKLWCGRSKKR